MAKKSLVSLICCFFCWTGSTATFLLPSVTVSRQQEVCLFSPVHQIGHLGKGTDADGKQLCRLHVTSTVDSDFAINSHRLTPRIRKGVTFITRVGIILLLTSNAAVAKPAATITKTAAPVLLPPMHKILLSCLLPTLLGFYKSEYGVSYGYGTAIAASSFLILSSISQSAGMPVAFSVASIKPSAILTSLAATLTGLLRLIQSSIPAFHASALFFYGTRLNLFLLYRELCLPRFRAMRERIEDRANKQGSRLKRTPFLISCAFLYFCMVCPVLITTKVCEGMSMSSFVRLDGGLASFLQQSIRLFVILTLSGFLLGAFGDLNKSIGKMLKGEDSLITGGIFRFFRHPNYTGEVIGWVSSCLAAFSAVTLKAVINTSSNGNVGLCVWRSMAGLLSLSVIGTIGIAFVLGTATAGLEFRQHEKYGDTEEYKQWVKKSWVGFKMQKKVDNAEETNEE